MLLHYSSLGASLAHVLYVLCWKLHVPYPTQLTDFQLELDLGNNDCSCTVTVPLNTDSVLSVLCDCWSLRLEIRLRKILMIMYAYGKRQ